MPLINFVRKIRNLNFRRYSDWRQRISDNKSEASVPARFHFHLCIQECYTLILDILLGWPYNIFVRHDNFISYYKLCINFIGRFILSFYFFLHNAMVLFVYIIVGKRFFALPQPKCQSANIRNFFQLAK